MSNEINTQSGCNSFAMVRRRKSSNDWNFLRIAFPIIGTFLAASTWAAELRHAYFLELPVEPAVRVYLQTKEQAAPGVTLAQREANATASARIQMNRIASAQAGLRDALSRSGLRATEVYGMQHLAAGLTVLARPSELESLRALPGVARVRPVQRMEPNPVRAIDGFIGAASAWGWAVTNLTGAGIRIGVIDTGVDYHHVAFGGSGTGYEENDTTRIDDLPGIFPNAKVVGGYDFAGDAYTGYNLPVADPDPMDCDGHGTSVAGVAAGFGVTTNGETFTGPYGPTSPSQKLRIPPGMAPEAQIYALRVFGCSGGTYLVPQAFEWAMDPNGDGSYDDRLDVVNVSIGSVFKSPDDLSVVASDLAAEAGVFVAQSAGNDYNTFFISGSRGDRALVTAASMHDTYWTYAIEVQSPASIAGFYEVALAEFGPALGAIILTNVVYADPPLASTALLNAAAVSNRICLIDRGSSTFATKVKNAQDAGAVAVIMVNNIDGPPSSMGGADPSITIPSVMVSMAVGEAIKSNLVDGVTAAISAQTVLILSNRADTIVNYSSQGPSLGGILKPDIAAPTEIMAPRTFSGDQGSSFNGTSCSAPVMAGVAALMRQRFPNDTVEEIKARLLNTAVHDIYLYTNGVPPRLQPNRAGSGRVDVTNALAATMIAYFTNSPGTIHGSYDHLAAGVVTQKDQQVRIVNRAATPQTLQLAYDPVADLPGATFTLPGGTNLVLPAGAATTLTVRLTADPAGLRNTPAPAVPRAQFADGADRPRYWLPEESGYLLIKPATGVPLRVALHAAVRPASALSCTTTQAVLGAATGTVPLVLTGTGVNTGSSFPSNWVSMTSVLGLQWRDPDTTPLYGRPMASGAMTDWPSVQAGGGSFADAHVVFGVVMAEPVPSVNGVAFRVHIDRDGDGRADAFVETSAYQLPSNDPSDAMGTWVDGMYQAPLNGISPTGQPTGVFHSQVYALVARVGDLGLTEGNSSFSYYIETSFDFMFHYRTPSRPFTIAQPGLWWRAVTGGVIRAAQPGTNIVVNYNRANAERDMISGVLLLHHLNEPSAQAEYIPFLATNLVEGTLYVARTGSHTPPFSTWATAATNPVAAAALAADGATILVSNGTYGVTGPVILDRAVTLRSVNGPAVTVFNGRGTNRTLLLNHPGAFVVGLTFSNGYAQIGGAVMIDAGGGTMSNSVIRNSFAVEGGGGVYMRRAGLLTACRIEGNVAGVSGGGVMMQRGALVQGCAIVGNRAQTESGGGVFALAGGTIVNSTGTLNVAAVRGGAVLLEEFAEVVGGVYSLNTSQWGGAIGFVNGGLLRDAVLATNEATSGGGGFHISSAGMISNALVRANRSLDGGGGLLRDGGAIFNSLIEDNEADWGGGLLCWGNFDNGYVSGCIIRSNEAVEAGGGVQMYEGGIVRGSLIENNRAAYGGGVQFEGWEGWLDQSEVRGNEATSLGGGIDFNNAGRVTASLIVSNRAESGGGVNMVGESLLDSSQVIGNTAPNYGGGVYMMGGAIRSTLIAMNDTYRGGGIFAEQGGEVANSTIVANEASDAGGGVWNQLGGSYLNSIVYDNSAPSSPNYTNVGVETTFEFVCTSPLVAGVGNFVDPPLLSVVATNYGVPLAGSPVIGTAQWLYWMPGANDAAGLTRIVGDAPDIGAFEYPFTASGIDAHWLMANSLFTDGSDDFVDSDGDGQDNFSEWRSQTDPRDASSFFGIAGATAAGAAPVIRWASTDGATYRVERTTNLVGTAFTALQTNIPAIPPMNVHTDVTATGIGQWIYRVEME